MPRDLRELQKDRSKQSSEEQNPSEPFRNQSVPDEENPTQTIPEDDPDETLRQIHH